MTLRIERHYAEGTHAECHDYFDVMLSAMITLMLY
jgi:hypothetical protein